MSPKAKIWFIRWLVFEAVTIVIALMHFIFSPFSTHPFALAAYGIVLAGAAALCITFFAFRKRHGG